MAGRCYFIPDTYDNVVYYMGARAIAATGSFTFEGKHVVDWPPGVSAIFAIPMVLGFESVVVSKALVVILMGVSLALMFHLFKKEGRRHAMLIALIFGLTPTALQMAIRTLSEWPFIAMSFLFLILLDRLSDDRPATEGAPAGSGIAGSPAEGPWPSRRAVGLAIFLGLLLGGASLTRYIGNLLGIAVLVQAARKLQRRRDLRAVLQGERTRAADNRPLGRFHLEGIMPAPRGVPKIEVTFDIDANGILSMHAKDTANGKDQRITITAGSGLAKEAREDEADDQARREQIETRNKRDDLGPAIAMALPENEEKIPVADANSPPTVLGTSGALGATGHPRIDPPRDPDIEAEWKRMQSQGRQRSFANGWRVGLVLLTWAAVTGLMLLAVFALNLNDSGKALVRGILVGSVFSFMGGAVAARFVAKLVGWKGLG